MNRAALSTMVNDLQGLVECESPSGDLAAVRRSAEGLAELGYRRVGRAPELVEVQGTSHLLWRLGRPEGRRILVLGHHDTVWPIGSLIAHPFRFVDDRITGPGCFDMKAGIVLSLHALGQHDLRGNVTLLFTGDEEIGSGSSRDLILSEASDAAAVFVVEPSAGEALKIARKGAATYRVDITGRAAHAGLEPQRGINAALEMARVILAVSAMGNPALGTTVTPTLSFAGVSSNTVPDKATVRVDARAESLAEQQRVTRQLREVLASTSGASLQVAIEAIRPPLETAASKALFELAKSVATDLHLPRLEGIAVGGASDGNFTGAQGIRTLDGLGAVGGGAHAAEEHVVASSLPARARLLRGLVDKVAAGS